jgi:uncharacterized membrane protein
MKPAQRYLVAGLLVWIPLAVTFVVLKLIVDLVDETLFLIPQAYRPEALLGFRIPGLGIILTGAVVLLTGVLAANFLGRRLLVLWEAVLGRIPFVRSIYGSARKFSEVLFADRDQTFKKVLLVEYPRKGAYRLGFQTAIVPQFGHQVGREVVSVFVPNSPNVAAGFLVMLPREDVIEIDMDVETAVKMIVSLGVVVPADMTKNGAKLVAPAAPPP